MVYEVRMNKSVCSFDSCCDLFSSMSLPFNQVKVMIFTL